jgi:hypothetical protein
MSSKITEFLGGQKVVGRNTDLSQLAEEGLPKQALIVFMEKSNLDESRLYAYLDIT